MMLSPEEFIDRWGDDEEPLVPLAKEAVDGLSIPEDDKAFLAHAGLPESTAPFLNFDVHEPGPLRILADEWDLPDSFAVYRVIGDDGAGNPIVLDESRNGEVVMIDHDNDYIRIPVNQSIRQLAESLLAFQRYGDACDDFGTDAIVNRKIEEIARIALKQELTRIDPGALNAGSFWSEAINELEVGASESTFLPEPEPPPSPSYEEWKLDNDRKWYESLGEERVEVACRKPGCNRGAIPLTVFCRVHHYENIQGEPCPFAD